MYLCLLRKAGMSLYQTIAEPLQYILPKFYKDRYFKKIKKLSTHNFSELNIEPEILWMKNFLSQEDVMMDIGANTGSFIFQLEDKLLPQNIYAFEPNSTLFKRLVRIFPKVNVFPIALSDCNETAAFKVPIIKGEKRNTRGTLNTEFREVDEESCFSENVEVQRLDDWMSGKKIGKIDFMKIDVEGNALKTLMGAEATIKKFKPTLMVEMEQRHHQDNIWIDIQGIEKWGYKAHYLNRNSFTTEILTEKILLENFSNEKDKTNYINNIIFIPIK